MALSNTSVKSLYWVGTMASESAEDPEVAAAVAAAEAAGPPSGESVRIDSWIKNDVARRLVYGDFEQIQGIWTARHLEMTDLRRKSRTVLRLDKLQYNVPLEENNFTLQALRRES